MKTFEDVWRCEMEKCAMNDDDLFAILGTFLVVFISLQFGIFWIKILLFVSFKFKNLPILFSLPKQQFPFHLQK